MSKVLELKRTRKDLVAKLEPLAEKDELTPEEETSFTEMRGQAEGLARQIERLGFVEGQRAALKRLDPVPSKPRPDAEPHRPAAVVGAARKPVENPGFACVGELVFFARFQPRDPRIQALQEMGTGTSGGLAIPDEINPTLREVAPNEAILRARDRRPRGRVARPRRRRGRRGRLPEHRPRVPARSERPPVRRPDGNRRLAAPHGRGPPGRRQDRPRRRRPGRRGALDRPFDPAAFNDANGASSPPTRPRRT